jgi:hypothetical protein
MENLMLRTTLLFAIAFPSVCCAADSPTGETILKVYPVGDLVSVGAVNRSRGGKTTSDEWASEYPETLQALDELRSIVETVCSAKPVAVTTYAPSLSLIVRHSQDGHAEINQLLRTLGEDNQSSIQMECRALYSGSDGLPKLRNPEDTEAWGRRLEELMLSKRQITEAETTELLDSLSPEAGHKQPVALKSGRRTPWGPAGRPCTAMGRINHAKRTVEIRIDYISDDYAEATPFGSQVFSLAEGESALFNHYCDGGTTVWLITARIVTQETSSTLISQSGQ